MFYYLNFFSIIFYYLLNSICIITNEYFNDKILIFIKNNGVFFIKLIQAYISRDTKKINNDLKSKLLKLSDECFNKDYEIIEKYNYIHYKPIKAGSLNNIFLIYYKNKKCILKLLKKDIKKDIKKSFDNYFTILKISKYFNKNLYESMKSINISDYKNILYSQCNLETEVKNTNIFRKIFSFTDKIIIPEIYESKENYIVMSYEKGISFKELIENYKEYKNEAIFLIYIFFSESCKNNYIHGDFHIGNFLFRIDNNNIKLIVIDFGVINYLNNLEKKIFISFFNYTLYFEKELCLKSIYQLNDKYNFLNLENIKEDNLKLLNIDLDSKYINFYNIPMKYLTFFNLSFYLIILKDIINNKRIIIDYLNYINDNNFI